MSDYLEDRVLKLEMAYEKAKLELEYLVKLLDPAVREKLLETLNIRLCSSHYTEKGWWCVEHDKPAVHDGDFSNELCYEYARLKGCSCHTPEELALEG